MYSLYELNMIFVIGTDGDAVGSGDVFPISRDWKLVNRMVVHFLAGRQPQTHC